MGSPPARCQPLPRESPCQIPSSGRRGRVPTALTARGRGPGWWPSSQLSIPHSPAPLPGKTLRPGRQDPALPGGPGHSEATNTRVHNCPRR